jgi:hypothetical protein
MKKVLLFILFAAFGAAGLWNMAVGIGAVAEAAQSSGWPTTPGQVFLARVHRTRSPGLRSRSTTYEPEVSYTYGVGGQTFIGTMIAPGRLWSSASAYDAVNTFPVGARPPVCYAPSHPQTSVLVSGLHAASLGALVFGLVLGTFAAVFGKICLGVARGKQLEEIGAINVGLGGWLTAVLVIAEVGCLIWLAQ